MALARTLAALEFLVAPVLYRFVACHQAPLRRDLGQHPVVVGEMPDRIPDTLLVSVDPPRGTLQRIGLPLILVELRRQKSHQIVHHGVHVTVRRTTCQPLSRSHTAWITAANRQR